MSSSEKLPVNQHPETCSGQTADVDSELFWRRFASYRALARYLDWPCRWVLIKAAREKEKTERRVLEVEKAQ